MAKADYDRAVLLQDRDRMVAARSLYEELAAASHPGAMNTLGKLLALQRKTDEAVTWLRRAAEAGDTEALWNLAMMLRSGPDRGEVDDLLDRAEQQWLAIATASGDPSGPEAAAGLAMIYEFRGDEQEHRRWTAEVEAGYRAAVQAGHPEAGRHLGQLLGEQKRDAEAEPLLRAAARAGDDRAMFSLAVLLREGGRTPEALRWLRRAARKGNAQAMGAIGEIFAQQQRMQRAKWWLRRAARAGSPGAMNNLGILLKEGGNYVSAALWYRRAAAAGDPTADHNLRILWQDAGQAY